jgi:hypothetical protein
MKPTVAIRLLNNLVTHKKYLKIIGKETMQTFFPDRE